MNPSPQNQDFSVLVSVFFEVFFQVLIFIDFWSIPGPPRTNKSCKTMGGYAKIKVLQKTEKSGFDVDFSSILGSFWRPFGLMV